MSDYQTQSQQYLFNTYARYPLTLVRGQGAYVFDHQGKKYLDFLSGIACTPLGHCHPAVTQAILEQAQTLLHSSNLYYTAPSAELAQFLIQHGALDKIFFCNSGAEANEGAIKLARKYQWMQGKSTQSTILSASHSFHGRTLAALAATAKPSIQTGFAPLPQGFKYADYENIASFCATIDSSVAAVILEPIQGESGIRVMQPEFLQAVRLACDKVGALLIFDEIQCGIGRTGQLFAYQHYDVKPDIITLAKGLANGLPIGAICATDTVAAAFQPGDHGSTFGGNPVACRAALATLKTLIEQDYLKQVQKLSDQLFRRLTGLQAKYPQIKEVRGIGFMVGIELNQNAMPVLAYCQDKGLLINVAAERVIRLLPPYIIQEEELAFACDCLEGALEKL